MNALEKILVDLALDKQIITQNQLVQAFDELKSSPMKNFGRILADLKFITENQLDELRAESNTIFRDNGSVRKSTSGKISLKQGDDYSAFIDDHEVKRYSKPRKSEIIEKFKKNDTDRLIGSEFVGCQVIEKLGQGGMGRIYKVKHLFLNKYMAMKVLARQYTEQKLYVQRFFREARSAAKLNHSNIVKIYDVGQMSGEYYMLMQLVDGIDLKKVILERGKISVRDALFIVSEVAKALIEAHRHKIIHRDIKPDNIMLDKRHVLVTDFGLAKIEKTEGEGEGSEFMTLTGPGQVLGSPYFMAPEQADSSHEVDHRTDIYSLGSTFYYLITGKNPYDGPNAIAIIFKRINEPLIRPKKLEPMMPECINKLIIKMMAIKRENRQESAQKLLREIEELPIKNRVERFEDMDLNKNINVNDSNRLFTQAADDGLRESSSNRQAVKAEKTAPTSFPVDKSKAKTKIRKVSTYKNDAEPIEKTADAKENYGFITMTDFASDADIVTKSAEKESKPERKTSAPSVPKKKLAAQAHAPKIEKKAVKPMNMAYKSISKQKLKSLEKNKIVKDLIARIKHFIQKKDVNSAQSYLEHALRVVGENNELNAIKLEIFNAMTSVKEQLEFAGKNLNEKNYAHALRMYKTIMKRVPENNIAKKQ
ncbi:MAG: serine/threonine protein kinase, partial [Planctomycetes bacterium]|nr:serine/threonine protein kinase [Planctomycetota bacterium]